MLYISQQATHRMGYGSKLHHSIYLRIYLHITQLHCLIPQKKGGGPTPGFSYWTFLGFGGQWICRKFEISDTFL